MLLLLLLACTTEGTLRPPDDDPPEDTGLVVDTEDPDEDTGQPVDTDTGQVVDTGEPCQEQLWYWDLDGDGWGDEPVQSCEAPAHSTNRSGDCDDSAADVYPGAVETCDGRDEDCDGEVDEDAWGLETWYQDADGDGWGDALSSVVACDAPPGHVSDDTDCDDTRDDTWPGAPDACGDRIDQDCDGVDLHCGPTGLIPTSSADTTLYGEESSDWAAYALAGGDVDEDGYADLLLSAPWSGSSNGKIYLILGPPSPGSVSLSSSDAAWEVDSTHSVVGKSQAILGDMDGDGYAELAAGSPNDDSVGEDAGMVWVLSADASGTGDLEDALATVSGSPDHADWMGSVLAGGDVDGDGTPDLLVGAVGKNPANGGAGDVLVYSGPVSGDLESDDADHHLIAGDGQTLAGAAEGDSCGTSLATGDLDGDGYLDVILGDLRDDTVSGGGAVHVVYGPLDGVLYTDEADLHVYGTANEFLGTSVTAPVDLDGDGVPDLVAGAPGATEPTTGSTTGGAYVFAGAVGTGTLSTYGSGHLLSGSTYSSAGTEVMGAGDVDGDGLQDLLVGAPSLDGASTTDTGGAWLAYGPITADASLGDALFYSLGANDRAGQRLAAPGDMDGDGYDDLVLGAYRNDDSAPEAGAAWVFLGGL